MNKNNFSKGVERLIDPISVGTLHFIQSFNRLLPRSIQARLITASSQKIPYMGFVVEPYSSFLCYEIADIKMAKILLPDNFELVKTKIFEDDEPKYYCIFGCFRAHTSAFWGARTEFYIIAEDQKTGLLSWIIVDYDTDTISYDKKNGLRSPNSSKSVITINHRGKLFVDIMRDDNSRGLAFDANVESGKMTNLDQRLWLEGNLSIGYGKVLSNNNADIFSLKFEPCEVEKALQIPQDNLNLELNSWYPGLFANKPAQIVCFPYAQHFISDNVGYSSSLENKDELLAAIKSIDFSKVATLSTKSFRIMFLAGGAVSFVTTVTLLTLLILK
ncbi:MAG: hypothetical protein WCH58_02810 [Candidatus Saccharibacteria bacterium]